MSHRLGVVLVLLGSAGALGLACSSSTSSTPGADSGVASPDSSTPADGAAPEASTGCGVPIPTKYESTAFATNAAAELKLAERFEELETTMKATEGASTTTTTAAALKAIFREGAPSLHSVSTPAAQATLDAYFDAFEGAMGKTWSPEAAAGDGGAPSGGKYGAYHFSKTGVDLREAAEKTLLGGALYNHVLTLAKGPVTEATIDRFLAAFGAKTALANRTDADAGAEIDELIAEYASKRDDKSSAVPGPYRKMRTALLTMKAAVSGGEKCKADLDGAISTFLREWERTTYATAVYYLNAAALAAVDPAKGPQTLHAYGEALGLIQSFSGLPAEKRKITDAQIDALLAKIAAGAPHTIASADGALKLNAAIADIGTYEGFTTAELESFRKNF